MEFTPPDVAEGTDIFEHLWATRTAVQAWQPEPVKFTEITIGNDLWFELATHPRLRRYEVRNREVNSIWGIPIKVTTNWTRRRSYTVTYQEA